MGWHTWQPLEGSPSHLDEEIAAMRPSYAVVMLGTNDTYAGSAPRFARDLRRAGSTACDFSANGSRGGYNVRNRVTLEALDRVRRALGDGPIASR